MAFFLGRVLGIDSALGELKVGLGLKGGRDGDTGGVGEVLGGAVVLARVVEDELEFVLHLTV